MSREDFAVWAPAGSRWAAWAKPVLFAFDATPTPVVQIDVPRECLGATSAAPTGGYRDRPPPAHTAVIVDHPGVASIYVGVSLARLGFRPIPLFNALPSQAAPLIDVDSIVAALIGATPRLAEIAIAPDAPPAFLLDANRMRPIRSSVMARFNNMSVSFPTDFPSHGLLLEGGIRRVVVLTPSLVEFDLVATLRLWQDAGIEICRSSLDATPVPWTYGLWERLHGWWARQRANQWRRPDGAFGRPHVG